MALLTENQRHEDFIIAGAIMAQTDFHIVIEHDGDYTACRTIVSRKILFDNKLMPFNKAFKLWLETIEHRDGNGKIVADF